MAKLNFRKPSIRRTTRTDRILHFRQQYTGDLHQSPKVYNRAFASVLRAMADALEAVDDAWADPEVVIWAYIPGLITAELPLSEPVPKKKKRT